MGATGSRSRGWAAARIGTRSLGYLVQLNLVAERIEHVAAAPPGDGGRLLEACATVAQTVAHRVEVVDAECEVASRVQTKVQIGRKMHVSGRGRVPDPVTVRQRFRAPELGQTKRFSVEIACLCFLTRRVKDLRGMERNGHEIESKSAIM